MPIQTQFNRSAKQYDTYSYIQSHMAHQLIYLIKEEFIPPASILDVGCGTGILTKKLYHTYPHAQITALDMAENMLRVARQKLPFSNIYFLQQNIESPEWAPEDSYNLITSNAVFQWFTRPLETIQSLKKSLRPEGWVFASTFGPRTFCELNALFYEVEHDLGLSPQTHHLPLKSAEDWSSLFKKTSLRNVSVVKAESKVYYPTCRHFLHAVKTIGASYSQNKHPFALQKKVLQEVMSRYDTIYSVDNSVYATYEQLYIKGQKAPEKSKKDETHQAI